MKRFNQSERFHSNRYPLGVDASELETDGDGEKLASVAKLARERMAAEMKDIAKTREERKLYRFVSMFVSALYVYTHNLVFPYPILRFLW